MKCHRIKALGCDNNDKFSDFFRKVTYPQFHDMSSNAHVTGGNKRPKLKQFLIKEKFKCIRVQ